MESPLLGELNHEVADLKIEPWAFGAKSEDEKS